MLRCKGVTKQIVGVIPKGLALRVVLVDLHSKDESGKGFKLERKPMEFKLEDRVCTRFALGKELVGAIAYKLELPQELSRVHNTFHVSNLKKCYADEPLAVSLDGLHIDDILFGGGREEEEEHPALADSVPLLVHRVSAWMSIREQPPTPFWSEAEIARLLDIPSPLPSPLSPWLSPLPQILSPSLLVSSSVPVSPPPLPTSPTYLASVAMIRVVAPSTYILAPRSRILPSETPSSGTPPLLPIPLPTLLPPLLLPSTECRACVSEATFPPRKRLCIALGLRYEVGESSSAPTARPTGGLRADYRFVGTLDDEISQRMTDFVTAVRHDTDEIYGRLDDAQDDRSLMSGRLNMLFRDRRAHARTALLMEREARLSSDKDCSLASSKPRSIGTACGDTKTDEYTAHTSDSTEMIDQGDTDALAARDADKKHELRR
ncbi:hypothetical protein Tco_1056229 [Tanacetum coccineum]|uniref:Tf2-1-like SH3-like domain-containing protein n=1 Tax=Tanacetum coccineum TaxID=301880 RepID=A0ABQ5H1W7_9ASTR